MQISDIFTSELPVGETLRIRRNRFSPSKSVENPKRISIVSGIHGDELEGQLVIYQLVEWLKANQSSIEGIIDIYPAVNSLGVDTIIRSFPMYDVDLNRMFPGGSEEFLPGQVVHALAQDIEGSDIAIDIHSSNIFLREIPQIRINREFSKETLPLAKQLNCDFIWIHDAVTVLESTFSHTMNEKGTKTLVVEMGVGMRLTKAYGTQLLEGIIHLMQNEGIVSTQEQFDIRKPFSSEVGEVYYLNAPASGLFVPLLDHCAEVKKEDKIGDIVDPLTGSIIETLTAPSNGILFTLREYPVVYEGSLIARIFGEAK